MADENVTPEAVSDSQLGENGLKALQAERARAEKAEKHARELEAQLESISLTTGKNLTLVNLKMGIAGQHNLNFVATQIVKEAVKNTRHRGVVQMAAKISQYATASNAEAVGETFADVYANKGRAKRDSKAIVGVIDKYLKNN